MDKKKIGILAVILFLVIGLGTFVFANPNNEENLQEGERDGNGEVDSTDGESDETRDHDELTADDATDTGIDTTLDSSTATTRYSYSRNSGTTTTSGVPDSLEGTGNTTGSDEVVVTTDYYQDALKAVEQAESSLVQGDVDYATNLVDKVTDNSQKDELNSRLEAVQNIIDVTELVETLENKVNNSANRDDILASIDYRDDEKIEELVSNLTNDSVKSALTDRLETVNKILNDNESPVISGIANNSFTKKDVSLTISDTNEVTTTVTLNGEAVDYTDTFTNEGTYVVTVVDAAFNETTLTFTIDKTKPVITGVEDGKYYNSDVAVTIDDTNPGTVHLSKDGKLVKPYKAGDPITEEGTYTVYVADKAGNKSDTITFVIDKTAPAVLSLTQEYQDKEGGRIKVTITTSEEIYGDFVNNYGWRKVGENTYENYYYRTKDVTIDATDKAGNLLNYTFTVDMTAPVVKTLGITDINEFEDEVGKLYVKNGDTVRVMIYFDEKLGTEPTVKLGGKEYTATYRDQSSRPEDNHYAYYADIKITDDMNLSDGIIPFEVYGYADTIGNVGKTLTETNVNSETYPSVTLDNTKAKAVELKFHSSNENNSYAKPGDWFGVYLVVNEQLKENPTFIVNGVEYKANQFEENGGNYKYAVVYEIPSNTAVGKMTFEISNIVDLAGNVSDNLSNNDTDMSITYDNVSPGPKTLGITGFFNENEDAHYITYGKKVRVLTYYNEKLGTNPIVKIGNKEFNTYYTEESSDPDNNSYAYYADITITEDLGLSEGEIPFTVYGHKDLAGNEGRAYTNADITYNENDKYENRYDRVILDNTNPSVSIGGTTGSKYWFQEQTIDVVVTEANLDSIYYAWNESSNDKNMHNILDSDKAVKVDANDIIDNGDGTYTVKITINKEGRYVLNVKAVDKAGNTTYTRKGWYQIDRTEPTVILHKNSDEAEITPGIHNYCVSATVSDDNMKSVKLNNNDYESDTIICDDGNYTLTATDKAGNAKTINFTVDRTKPVISINDEEFTGKDNTGMFYNKVDLSINEANDYKVTAWYNDEKVDFNELDFTKDGKYKIEVKDAAINYTSVEFTLDTIPATLVELRVNSSNDNKDVAKVGDSFGIYLNVNEELKENPTFTVNGKEYKVNQTEENNGNYKYAVVYKVTDDMEEGEIEFTISNIYDKAGNPLNDLSNKDANGKIVIDKTAPTATITYNTVDPTNHAVVATLTASEDVKILNAGTWNPDEGYATIFKKSYPENQTQTVTIEDRAGNQNTVEVVINNIDKEAPSIGALESNKEYKGSIPYSMSDNSGSFTLYYDLGHGYQTCEELIANGATMGTINGSYSGTYAVPGNYEGVSVCLVDAAGNTTFRNNITITQ